MSKQCLSIEKMKHLQALGLDTSKASAYWHRVVRMRTNDVVTNWFVSFSEPSQCLATMKVETVQTFTLQDILDLLPNLISNQEDENNYWLEFGTSEEDNEWWYIRYTSVYGTTVNYEEDEYLIDAAYEMLCWCIENGYIETNKKNKICQ